MDRIGCYSSSSSSPNVVFHPKSDVWYSHFISTTFDKEVPLHDAHDILWRNKNDNIISSTGDVQLSKSEHPSWKRWCHMSLGSTILVWHCMLQQPKLCFQVVWLTSSSKVNFLSGKLWNFMNWIEFNGSWTECSISPTITSDWLMYKEV